MALGTLGATTFAAQHFAAVTLHGPGGAVTPPVVAPGRGVPFEMRRPRRVEEDEAFFITTLL